VSGTGFQLRAPWYVRERGAGLTLRSPRARRPVLQMYDAADFVDRLLEDPADSLRFGADDRWSYPVPVTPDPADRTRTRLATSRLLRSHLRKLYQPMHDRFYVVVVEVFCDSPGLPRAGSHDDLSVAFRMRRMHTTVTGKRRPSRRLARDLVVELAAAKDVVVDPDELDPDCVDVWWADRAWRRAFAEDHKEQLDVLDVHADHQQWLVSSRGGRWRTLDDDTDPVRAGEREETHRMWRLPPRVKDAGCDAAATRSLWFGVVPTFSSEHWRPPGTKARQLPKLDDQAIYEIECVLTQQRPPAQAHCPPRTWVSAPTEPFRLAAPMDPDGTKNRTTTLTLPDLRRLAARAGQRQGPGGVQVRTPPQSQLVVNPFKGIPDSGAGRVGAGGGTCTFALELFFIVAFFLFLLFLPIVVLAFQLWWMLALRFCIPPRVGFKIAADFLATGKLLADLDAAKRLEVDVAMGTDFTGLGANASPTWVDKLAAAKDPVTNQPVFANDSHLTHALVVGTDPEDARKPAPPRHLQSPDDPLCPVPASPVRRPTPVTDSGG
jgi:hypothetical protein